MTSERRSGDPQDRHAQDRHAQDRHPQASDPQAKGRTLQAEIGRIATRTPPPPEHKGLAMVVLAVVVVIAAIWQLATGGGSAARQIRENHPKQPKALTGAEAPSPPANTGQVSATATTHVALPIAPPGSDIELPAGISAATATKLRPALSALRPPRPGAGAGEREIQAKITEDALRNLAALVKDADEGERALVRALVLDGLAEVVARKDMGTPALDAALSIVGSDPVGAKAVIDQARGPGLDTDATAMAAIIFLGRLEGDHTETEAALKALLKDASRPARIRVLALDRLLAWDTALDDDPALQAAIEALPR